MPQPITAATYQRRRRNIVEALDGGLVCLTGYGKMQRSNDAAFSFSQEANFRYLTGINEPDWWLILDGIQSKSWLVMPDVSDVHRIFDGALVNEEARRISGVDMVVSHDEAMSLLRKLASKRTLVYTTSHPITSEQAGFTLNPRLSRHRRMLERTFSNVQDCTRKIQRLRAIKDDDEIALLQAAIDVTMTAFTAVHQQKDNMKYEYEVQAEFDYVFAKTGLRHAYDPIVAAGQNACTLHYVKNHDRLRKRSLLLLDVGAEHGGYAADISRTYALGEPTKRQQQLHEALQAAQAAIIKLIQPYLSFEAYQRHVDEIMAATMAKVGLAKDDSDIEAFRRYMPHAVSHGLGLDVHDSLGGHRQFEPGMVLTVEPGIYVREEGIGIRIEDDIVVTAKGQRNLSARLSTGWQ